jgi:ferrochelatase
MEYQGQPDFAHDAPLRAGVLLTNLGTPDAPERKAVRRYLAEFLSDPRVVERPRWLWLPVLYGIILNIRPRQSAEAYAKVWSKEGSPLLVISRRLTEAVAERLQQEVGMPVPVALGMRYGNPSVESALNALRDRGAERIVALPLYPQYSASTTGSTFDAIADVLKRWRWVPKLRFITHYHDDAGYIEALASSIRAWREKNGAGEKLLLSFHGIPQRYFDAGDPYHCHCQKTARLLAETLDLDAEGMALSFQSRIGPEAWLKPYTDETLKSWAGAGVRRVDVAAPGFAVDCLETLEEIAMRYAEDFGEHGGELRYIPALNDEPAHVEALCRRLIREAGDWWGSESDSEERRTSRLKRARAMGARR